MSPNTSAQSIDEVIQALDDIIAHTERDQNPLGYFAALYRLVTVKVKEGIANGSFDDGPRMERLDVVFANRYLKAYKAYQDEQPTTKSWQASFLLSRRYWPIVLQHLLIGMNAHINLDLGIAAAEVMKGEDIGTLESDFNRINEVLSSLVHKVQQDLAEIWPALKFILKITGKLDDLITDFSMKLARDGAWKFAKNLAETPSPNQKELIAIRDEKVALKSRIITHPGWVLLTFLRLIRLGERGSVSYKIKALRY